MGKTHNNVISTIFTILIVLLVLGLLGGVIVWAAREQGLTVYVDYGKNRYDTKSVNTSIGRLDSGLHTFTVGSLTGETVDYNVEILSNENKNFEFAVDGKKIKWSSVDCSNYFVIQKQADGFTLSISENDTVTNVLKTLYSSDDMEIMYYSDMPITDEYFLVKVTTSWGEFIFPFGLFVDTFDCELTLSSDGVVF